MSFFQDASRKAKLLTMAKEATTEDRLRSRVLRLTKQNRERLRDMAERGKAIEQLYALHVGWQAQVPEELHKKVMQVFTEYVARCTPEPMAKERRRRKSVKDAELELETVEQ